MQQLRICFPSYNIIVVCFTDVFMEFFSLENFRKLWLLVTFREYVRYAQVGLLTQYFDCCCFLPFTGRSLGQILSLRATELPFESISPSLGKDVLETVIPSAVFFQVCLEPKLHGYRWEYVETVTCIWAISSRTGCPCGNWQCLSIFTLFSPFLQPASPSHSSRLILPFLFTWNLPYLFSLVPSSDSF